MTVPVISILRSTHPELKITLLTTKFFSTLYNQIPEINFIYFEPKHKTLRGLFGLSRKINKINPDFIVDLHDVLRTKILRLFLINKFGHTAVVNKGRKEKKLLIRGIKSEPLKLMHRRYAETFEELNIKINIDDFLIIHRYGKILPSENIVLVLVASKHRKEGFIFKEEILDWFKKKITFWKKENFKNHSSWVEAE